MTAALAPLLSAFMGLGPMEWMIIGIVAMLLFGKRLPEAGSALDKWATTEGGSQRKFWFLGALLLTALVWLIIFGLLLLPILDSPAAW
jgi:hypothetical protein